MVVTVVVLEGLFDDVSSVVPIGVLSSFVLPCRLACLFLVRSH